MAYRKHKNLNGDRKRFTAETALEFELRIRERQIREEKEADKQERLKPKRYPR